MAIRIIGACPKIMVPPTPEYCAGKLDIVEAQSEIAAGWTGLYRN
jgi:hypothetical protein